MSDKHDYSAFYEMEKQQIIMASDERIAARREQLKVIVEQAKARLVAHEELDDIKVDNRKD